VIGLSGCKGKSYWSKFCFFAVPEKIPDMIKNLLFLTLFTISLFTGLNAQTAVKAESATSSSSSFGIRFSGYVKTDILYDTRQTVGLRDGQFLLYPEPKRLDQEGKDINGTGIFNMLNIQTRLAGTITGPDALGAKTSGFIEAEFFGNTNAAINSFRLRHAYVKLNWSRTELLAGQTWHPMFSPDCFPNTVSFNTGAMFTVFSRNPQIRIIRNIGRFSVALAAISQLDFTSNGPDGANSKYLRNSMIPELDLQLQYLKKNADNGNEFLIGAGVDYLVLVPRLSSEVILKKAMDTVINSVVVHQNAVTAIYKTTARVDAFSYNFIAKLKLRAMTFKVGGYYGENSYGFTLLGGYAVKSVTDSVKGFVDYANVRTMTAWGEISTNGTRLSAGVFGGFSRNLGIGETVAGPYYSRGSDIDYLYRISPRLIWNIAKVRLAAELEYTATAYGKSNEKGYVYEAKEVANLRLLLGVYYFF
jgi:hypothetical protein